MPHRTGFKYPRAPGTHSQTAVPPREAHCIPRKPATTSTSTGRTTKLRPRLTWHFALQMAAVGKFTRGWANVGMSWMSSGLKFSSATAALFACPFALRAGCCWLLLCVPALLSAVVLLLFSFHLLVSAFLVVPGTGGGWGLIHQVRILPSTHTAQSGRAIEGGPRDWRQPGAARACRFCFLSFGLFVLLITYSTTS